MNFILNAIAVVTFPVWWPIMVGIECVQLACGTDPSKLLGPVIYEKLA